MTALALRAADLIFDPDTHTTRTPDGRDVPHVTKVLAETGVATDFEQVMLISRRLRDTVEDRRLLGSVVHADCHAFDDGDIVLESVDPRSRPYVDAWATCRRNLGLRPLARERRLYHPLYGYTGIYDGLFALPTGIVVLADLKIGDPDHAAAHLQTAAYEEALRAEAPGMRIDQRWAVQLLPAAAVPYRIVNYTGRVGARHDFKKFVAALTTYNEQPDRRRVA